MQKLAQQHEKGQAMLETVLMTLLVMTAIVGLGQVVRKFIAYDQAIRAVIAALPL